MKKTIASSGSIDGIKNIIAEYFYSTFEKIVLISINEKQYNIVNGSKNIDFAIVEKKKNRFNFINI